MEQKFSSPLSQKPVTGPYIWTAELMHNATTYFLKVNLNRDSSVGTALGYGLDDRGSMVRFPVWAGDFSLHHRVQNGSEAHPASYPMGTTGCFPEGKAAGA
jgi:hypothetical protein